MLAAFAVGITDNLEKSADKLLKIKKIYQPNPENRKIYDNSYKVFCELHDVLQPTFKHMAKIQEEN